jgi:putative transposase
MSTESLRKLVSEDVMGISISRQCALLGISRSGYYYEPCAETPLNLEIMLHLDKHYIDQPYYGVARMAVYIRSLGYTVGEKRIRRLLRLMGLEAAGPRPGSRKGSGRPHAKYPYLLPGFAATMPDQVWASDITYIPMARGFLYLTAVIDWYSRRVLAWRVSNTIDAALCTGVLNDALQLGKPLIFNTDQGSQYTSIDFTGILLGHGIQISMAGKGRCFDNIFIERLWRTVKYEYIYLQEIPSGEALIAGLSAFFTKYNSSRPHQSLGWRTPDQAYYGAKCAAF